jgi:N-acetylmuramoyl-L-alanine amidase
VRAGRAEPTWPARTPGSRVLVALTLAALTLLVPAGSRAASSSPDGALYREAVAAETKLRHEKSLLSKREEWERVVLLYRRVVARYPRSGYCDNALLAVGKLYREMGDRFGSSRYYTDSVSAFRLLVSEYPSSTKGDEALWTVFQIQRDRGSARGIAHAGEEYLDTFPRGRHASSVKKLMRQKTPAAKVPSLPPPGLAGVFDLRFWSGKSSTRVVLDLERKVELRSDRVGNPERLWIDLIGTRLHPNLARRVFPVGDGLLEQIRIAQNRPDVVRVVLDFKDSWQHNFFYLDAPPRLVIDVTGPGAREVRPQIADATAPPSAPPPADGSGPAKADPPSGSAPAKQTPADPPAAPSRAARNLPAPEPPAANRGGSYSLARQLGLGARTIVIDAGHGGHDPGTIGRGGLQEKDLVLDVAIRLERLVRKELGADVVMTRSTDVFIPLEERTAIANAKGADLFLSIHANASRNPRARGIETYFLNFARSSHAEAVAARENAISEATLKDLQGLVKAITLNTKIDESRDFASSVQEAMVDGVRRVHTVPDRGVHTAPFYVLIGANMPAVLAEIAFVSNPEDERRLRTPDYRDTLARSLLRGVKSYLEALNRTQTRQLTDSGGGSTVARGGPAR